MKITPSGQELLNAIEREINTSGEARCVKRIVETHCNMELRHAYELLKKNAKSWGLDQQRIKRDRGGGTVIKLFRLRNSKNDEKC